MLLAVDGDPDIITALQRDLTRRLLGAGVFYGAAVPEAGGAGNRHSGGFAAGDVRHGSVMRVASAVGEGASAVQQVHRYLAAL